MRCDYDVCGGWCEALFLDWPNFHCIQVGTVLFPALEALEQNGRV